MRIKILTLFLRPSQFQTKRFNVQLSFSLFFSFYYKLSCTAQVVLFTTLRTELYLICPERLELREGYPVTVVAM